jgi:outer membrane protein assembly factor BamB
MRLPWLSLAAALVLFSAFTVAAADNLKLTSVATDPGRAARDHVVLWHQRIGTDAGSLSLASGGKLLVGTNNSAPRSEKLAGDRRVLMCFNSADGSFLWQATHPRLSWRGHDLPGSPLRSIPAIQGDRAYYVSNRGEVVCLDLNGFRDGKNNGPFRNEDGTDNTDADIVWSIDMVGKLGVFKRDAGDIGNPSPSPLVLGDKIFCVTGNGSRFGYPDGKDYVPAPDAPSFLAADRRTGQVAWTSNAPGRGILYAQWSSPAVCAVRGQQQVIFAGGDGLIYGFVPGDGRLLWKLDCNPLSASTWNSANRGTKCFCASAPVVIADTLLVPMSQDYELSGLAGSSIVAVDLGRVQSEGRQAIRWTFLNKRCRALSGRLVVVGNLAFVLDTAGHLAALDITTGHIQWWRDLDDQPAFLSSPVVSDGSVFASCGEELLAFTADNVGDYAGRWNFNEGLAGTPLFEKGVTYVTTRTHVMAVRLQ